MAEVTQGSAPPRKNLMRSPVTWVIILGVTLAAGAWILLRRNQASQAAAQPAAGSTDFSGEISTLQAEIADLQSSEAQDKDNDGGGGTAGGGSGGGNGGTGGIETGGGQPPAVNGPPKQAPPPVPALVRVTGTTANSVSLSWSASPGATSYRVRLTYQGRLAAQQSSAKTSVTVSGLTANHTYTVHVAAVGPGGTSRETNGPAAKTSRASAAPNAAAHSAKAA